MFQLILFHFFYLYKSHRYRQIDEACETSLLLPIQTRRNARRCRPYIEGRENDHGKGVHEDDDSFTAVGVMKGLSIYLMEDMTAEEIGKATEFANALAEAKLVSVNCF